MRSSLLPHYSESDGIFSYANWVRKSLSAPPDENPATEILYVLDDRLMNEKTLTGRGVFGERLPWLIHFHRERQRRTRRSEKISV
jgi:hypothetical protein